MSELNYISDSTLPIAQSFEQLKAEGLALLQAKSGANWTNFNAADPGVTILDQVCYALTELGYCTNFPMADILTDSNNQLELKNQFYLPSQILTTTATTLTDYRKLIIDASPAVGNVYIESVYPNFPGVSAIYRTYIRLTDHLSSTFSATDLNNQLYFLLNSNRNLADFFEMPRILIPNSVQLYGEIDIINSTDFGQVLNQLMSVSSHAIFPECESLSYKKAKAQGYDFDELYNGPKLKNGFIPTDKLGEKQDSFTAAQLRQLLPTIAGISKVVSLQFSSDKSSETIQVTNDKLITFDWTGSIQQNTLVFKANGIALTLDQAKVPNQTKAATTGLVRKSKDTILPEGSFRDINTYYSIQNTFPAIYNIGTSNNGSENTDLQSSQASQLKGYLTLYDQVLANQFAQLANLGTIFSFKNALTAAPSDLETFYAIKNKLDPKPSQYPAPYRSFAPSYFCQSIYNTPNIRYLLKDNDTLGFTTEKIATKELAAQSWRAYQHDPYNAYMKGLLDLTIDERINLTQRNQVLNHLLARHGESPESIDQIIEGSQYTGSKIMDQIIFKSLYLQNIDSLSYYVPKAFDFYAAKEVSETLPELDEKLMNKGLEGFTRDFIFSAIQSDKADKIEVSDYIDFAGIQLKTNLLFGLTPLYEDYINENWSNNENLIQIQQVIWLNNQQKGAITIETGLILMGLKATVSFQINDDTTQYWTIDKPVNYYEFSLINNSLSSITIAGTQNSILITAAGVDYTITANNEALSLGEYDYQTTDGQYKYNFNYASSIINSKSLPLLKEQELIVILPSYLTVVNSVDYTNRLKAYLKLNLPVYQGSKIAYADEEALTTIIPAFAKWRNAMCFPKVAEDDTEIVMPDSEALNTATQALLIALTDEITT